MKYDNLKLRQMLAAEYALGTLRGRARRRLEKLAEKDLGLRREITFWESRLAELGLELKPVEPPPAVWLGIEHRTRVAAPKVTPIRPPAAPAAATAKPASPWRILAGLATAAAVVVAVLVGQRGTAPEGIATPGPIAKIEPSAPAKPAEPTYVALLKLPEATMQWTFSIAPEHGRVKVAASGEYAQLGAHSLELWVITPGGPVSLGVLPVSGTAEMPMPSELAAAAGDTMTLAVSLEPVGGSPTGKPTGPVLTSGAAVKAA